MPLPRLQVQGNRITDGTNPVMLRGVNIADPEHIVRMSRRLSISQTIELATGKDDSVHGSLGFHSTVVRIPVTPEPVIGDEECPDNPHPPPHNSFGYLHKKDAYVESYLDPAIEACLRANVYAVVDCHYVCDYERKKDQVLEFWGDMAARYRNYPNVIYEIFNEPVNPSGWSHWKSTVAQEVVNCIRDAARETLVLVGGPQWTIDVADAVHDPINDPRGQNIAYVAHLYPNVFEKFQKSLPALIEKFPVFITEWGFEQGIRNHDEGTKESFGKPCLQFMEENHLSWAAWILDPYWGPRIVDFLWNPTCGPGRMGRFVWKKLNELNANGS